MPSDACVGAFCVYEAACVSMNECIRMGKFRRLKCMHSPHGTVQAWRVIERIEAALTYV